MLELQNRLRDAKAPSHNVCLGKGAARAIQRQGLHRVCDGPDGICRGRDSSGQGFGENDEGYCVLLLSKISSDCGRQCEISADLSVKSP
ncbi:MAG: hypothetical protein AMJ43_08395 [Coxiella sp. DG_40]|nr:MAG: hypothetical protein AMJ43_08395 [Coxiella sp. DG_40]